MATVRMPKYTYDQNTYALPLFFICERFWTCLKKGQQLTQKNFMLSLFQNWCF